MSLNVSVFFAVCRKHVPANAGFVLAGAGLILFLAGVSYMAGLK
jgi:hypothetical protein